MDALILWSIFDGFIRDFKEVEGGFECMNCGHFVEKHQDYHMEVIDHGEYRSEKCKEGASRRRLEKRQEKEER